MTDPAISARDFRPLIAHVDLSDTDWNYHEWWVTGRKIYRDALGRKNGSSYRWMVLGCNNTDCPGEAICRSDVVERLVESFLPVPQPS